MDAGIKKRHYLTAVWVDAGEVRSLVQVSVVACEGKICWIVRTVMLLGYNVLDVQRRLEVRTDEGGSTHTDFPPVV